MRKPSAKLYMDMENKKRILLLNLAVDENDPVLGFAVPLIARIAAEAETVNIITVRKGIYSLPANVRVYSVGRERGTGRLASIFTFYRHLFHIVRTERITSCFTHMNALFAVLAGPVLAMRDIPLVLWYSHRHRGIIVRMAHWFASRIMTSAKEGYSSGDAKVLVVGQITDTSLFVPAPAPTRVASPLFISAGRIAPIKDALTFVRAAAVMRDAGYACTYRCIGPVFPHDKSYHATVCAEIRRLSVESSFSFAGAVPYAEMPAEYRRVFAHVNLCPDGSLDKAALEAMACGTPSVFANRSFVPVTKPFATTLVFKHGDPHDLARVLIGLLKSSPDSLDRMRTALREAVVRHHSLDSFVRQLMKIII